MAHPLGVSACQIVIDGDQLTILATQRVQIERACGHEGLTFTGRHFRDPFFMQRNPSDKLDIVVHHVPLQIVIANGVGLATQASGSILNGGKGFG